MYSNYSDIFDTPSKSYEFQSQKNLVLEVLCLQGWRMYLCIIWEFYILGGAEWLAPESSLAFLSDLRLCDRS